MVRRNAALPTRISIVTGWGTDEDYGRESALEFEPYDEY